MDFIPYKANEYLENVYYQIPKELFINPYYKDIQTVNYYIRCYLIDYQYQ